MIRVVIFSVYFGLIKLNLNDITFSHDWKFKINFSINKQNKIGDKKSISKTKCFERRAKPEISIFLSSSDQLKMQFSRMTRKY